MSYRISVAVTGGPDVLKVEDFNIAEPGPGEALVRHTAIGLNYIDTYLRTGLYPPPGFPFTPGSEGAGVIEALGADAPQGLAVGQRVAYGSGPPGGYATHRVMPAGVLIPIPDSISDEQAAGMMLKGMTTQYLIRQTHVVTAGETILFHAAAGGVGLIATQWAKHLGARVIGTAGDADKAALAKAHGCDEVILYRSEDVAKRVRELTGGAGVPVVYDGVGQATFGASLNSLQPRGLLVSFGNASGPVTGVNLGILAQKGSLYVTRPTLVTYTPTRETLLACAKDLIDVVAKGAVKIEIGQRYPLRDAMRAHADLEARKTSGSTLLLP